MQLDFEVQGTTLIAKLVGELDHHTARSVREPIDFKLASGIYHKLILDFTGLTFMDSSGIAVVMGRVNYLSPLGGTVEIRSHNEKINRILTLSGITKYARLIAG